MGSLAKLQFRHQPFHLSVNPHRPSSPKPISSLSFKTLPASALSFKLLVLRASSEPSNQHIQTLKSLSSPILKATCITVAAAALFFMRLHSKPAIAAPITTTTSSTVEPTSESTENLTLEEQERNIEKHLARYADDIEALRSLMEVRIKSRKLQEAIQVIDRLIELEPEEQEWPLLKAQIHSYSGDFDLAKNGFEEILAKDPLRVEAYHGLVMAYSESGLKLKDLEKRIEVAMDKCKKEKKKKDFRDFKLLVAQIRVIEGNHFEALKVYQELEKEEPRDFRPYLCQGIIYSLLKKKDEAEKQFEKFRRLVPRNHPYREYFVDNMIATELFAEKVDREAAGSNG